MLIAIIKYCCFWGCPVMVWYKKCGVSIYGNEKGLWSTGRKMFLQWLSTNTHSYARLFVCSFVRLFVCPFIRLSVCSFVRLFVCWLNRSGLRTSCCCGCCFFCIALAIGVGSAKCISTCSYFLYWMFVVLFLNVCYQQ